MGQMDDSELMAVLDAYRNPQLPLTPLIKSQALIGVVIPAALIVEQQTPPFMQLPLFSPFSRAANGYCCKDAKDTSTGTLSRRAAGQEERAAVAIAANGIEAAQIVAHFVRQCEAQPPLSDYGVA